jgi:N-acetylmuramic acid 6-phosphate etherase
MGPPSVVRRVLLLAALCAAVETRGQEQDDVLKLLQLTPSAESVHYVNEQREFQLHTLLTEQRHAATWNLSTLVRRDTAAGLRALFAVDQDVSRTLAELARRPESIELAVGAVVDAVASGRRVYVYGCGATGRLAEQMESGLWRPFWARLRADPLWPRLKGLVPDDVEAHLVGEMTGADRALIASLEGFEDLQLVGRLQLQERRIQRGDVVFGITEGGETSSVIGTILAAAEPYGTDAAEARRHLFFLYNNPDALLRPLARCRAVLEHPGITRINLTTGPQAITGSTRMQAATSETFVMGVILEEALERLLGQKLTRAERTRLGFPQTTLAARLLGFAPLQRGVAAAAGALAELTDAESEAYRQRRFATYFAERGLLAVFIDSTERSPTFRLPALDTLREPQRRCWIQVWTDAANGSEAWGRLLGRPFHGLAAATYRAPLAAGIPDAFLRETALRSLETAGDEQQTLYDFSMAGDNLTRRAPRSGDVCVAALLADEASQLAEARSPASRFVDLCNAQGARAFALTLSRRPAPAKAIASEGTRWSRVPLGTVERVTAIGIDVGAGPDPLGLRQQLALKMALNAHSTAVMARLGRVVGNTMTFVSPSNLKLVGRATSLIQNHVNVTLTSPRWVARYGKRTHLTYAEANAVLFAAKDFVKTRSDAEPAEVALSIIRILEALAGRAFVPWEKAQGILQLRGLDGYLSEFQAPSRERKTR